MSRNAAPAVTPIAPANRAHRVEVGRVWADNNANLTGRITPECPTCEHKTARCRHFHVHPLAMDGQLSPISKGASPEAQVVGPAASAHAFAVKAEVRGEHATHQHSRFRINSWRERVGPGQEALGGSRQVLNGPVAIGPPRRTGT